MICKLSLQKLPLNVEVHVVVAISSQCHVERISDRNRFFKREASDHTEAEKIAACKRRLGICCSDGSWTFDNGVSPPKD